MIDGGGAIVADIGYSKLVGGWFSVEFPAPIPFDLFKASSSINSSLRKFSRFVFLSASLKLD